MSVVLHSVMAMAVGPDSYINKTRKTSKEFKNTLQLRDYTG